MRITPLPAEVRYTLREHQGKDDAPVFVYRPLRPREFAAWSARIAGAGEGGDVAVLMDLCAERLVRVENLTVGDEPFDVAKHLDEIPAPWQIELGAEIYARSQLTDADVGK